VRFGGNKLNFTKREFLEISWGILKNCIKIYNPHSIDEYFQHFKLEQSKCKKKLFLSSTVSYG
jgi:hypothetical protein